VNANQFFFGARSITKAGQVRAQSSKLLPVTSSDSRCGKSASLSSAVGSLEIKLSKGTVHVAGNVDAVMLRTAIASFAGMTGLPAGTHIWIAAGVTDLRRGFKRH
jgi:hypothetical protein